MENSDIERIRAIWALVEPDKVHHGVEILIRLFDKFPETKAKFPRLKTDSAEAMRKSPRVRAHGGRVVVALGSIIGQLEDMELVDETIFLLGDSHNNRGVLAEDFEKFSIVFLAYLKEVLGDAYDTATSDAYSKLIGTFNKKISQHLDG